MIEMMNLKLNITDGEREIRLLIAKKLRIKEGDIRSFRYLKKSVDARKKDNVFYNVSLGVDAGVNEDKVIKNAKSNDIRKYVAPTKYQAELCTNLPLNRPVVCGAGPAGLFAALILAKGGLKPILIERGADADTRKEEIEKFFKTGILNGNTNVQFGEGGAGTFSDGKLTTNIKDKRCNAVLDIFYENGAPEEILYLAKPHLGTDNLINIVKNLRKSIIDAGGEVRFNTTLTDVIINDGALEKIITRNGDNTEEIPCNHLIIATGHSARDIFEMLKKHNVIMEKKPFSMGVRIEHLQEEISKSQYGEFYKYLPAADYKLSVHLPSGRSVYTFCMCPGGQVVSAVSEEGHLVVNGMSLFARDGKNANSALLVNVEPSDFEGDDVLSGVDLQQKYEKAAFKLGGSNYKAPAQLVGDFLKGVPSQKEKDVTPTYPLGVTWCDIKECLPSFVSDSLKEALPLFDNKIKGFASPSAVLTGVETRSSSPVRVLRNEESECNVKGIYPCGEGAGYAGGIRSAAVDGIRVAENLISKLNNVTR
ncbi:MAG: FAD-dependent oxidoreductase [Clostridia bacterium]|nr:FAD-dependent oxidoreductase [Clostridia bacterium]